MEKERADEMEVAAKENEKREAKEKTAKSGCCALRPRILDRAIQPQIIYTLMK